MDLWPKKAWNFLYFRVLEQTWLNTFSKDMVWLQNGGGLALPQT